MGLGSIFDRATGVPYPPIADFFTSIAVLSMFLAVLGGIIVAFGLFWGRWVWSIILGVLFAVGTFILFSF
jgi:hypothetical protein